MNTECRQLVKLVLSVGVAMLSLSLSACCITRQQTPTEDRRQVFSLNAIKWLHVERQAYDYSCGPAAIATIMRSYFGDQTDEKEIIRSILATLSDDDIKKRETTGFSLLDLKKQAQRMGYIVDGVKLKPTALEKLLGPVIILLKNKKQDHFVVLKGAMEGKVYLADSSRGNITVPMASFLEEWDGTTLILGKKNSDLPSKHKLILPTREELDSEKHVVRQVVFEYLDPTAKLTNKVFDVNF